MVGMDYSLSRFYVFILLHLIAKKNSYLRLFIPGVKKG
jgi:hypothetical protein